MHVPFNFIVSIGDSLAADIEPASQLGMQVLLVKGVVDLVAKIDMLFLNPHER